MARKVTTGHMALRQSEHNTQEPRTPPWELIAFDADGNELYAGDYHESSEAAQADADAFEDGSAYWVDNVPDEVDHFEPRKTE